MVKIKEKSLESNNNIKEKTSTNDLIKIYKNNNNQTKSKFCDEKVINNKYLVTDKGNEKFFKEYLETSLDDLEFDDAIVKDKRTFCEYFCDSFKEKQTIANTFFAKDPIKTRAIKIVLFIFDLALNFVINALFITED